MAASATEARILDRLKAALDAISAAAPGTYLTAPTVGEGVPLDSTSTLTNPALFADYVRTVSDREGTWGTRLHRATVTMAVWVVAKDVRTLIAAKADAVRAIFAAEAGFTGEFGVPLWPTDFAVRDEMTSAGEYCGVLLSEMNVELTHAAP